MSFVFVSHAAVDKGRHVRPLVHALALEKVSLWVDCPGAGAGNLGFDDDFVSRHGIQSLKVGQPWDRQISDALHRCAAVLGCLSRAVLSDRAVLHQELAIAWHSRKLVTCRLDGIDPGVLPANLGLPDLARLQAVAVDTDALSEAVAWLVRQRTDDPSALPRPLRDAWSPIKALRKALTAIAPVDQIESDESILFRLSQVPIGPAVMAHEIPLELIQALSDNHAQPEGARRVVDRAMALARRAHPVAFSTSQVVVRPGEVPQSEVMDLFWSAVVGAAGLKSRRTLAAVLESAAVDRDADSPAGRMLAWLKSPGHESD